MAMLQVVPQSTELFIRLWAVLEMTIVHLPFLHRWTTRAHIFYNGTFLGRILAFLQGSIGKHSFEMRFRHL